MDTQKQSRKGNRPNSDLLGHHGAAHVQCKLLVLWSSTYQLGSLLLLICCCGFRVSEHMLLAAGARCRCTALHCTALQGSIHASGCCWDECRCRIPVRGTRKVATVVKASGFRGVVGISCNCGHYRDDDGVSCRLGLAFCSRTCWINQTCPSTVQEVFYTTLSAEFVGVTSLERRNWRSLAFPAFRLLVR
jgi:hypothetical protein